MTDVATANGISYLDFIGLEYARPETRKAPVLDRRIEELILESDAYRSSGMHVRDFCNLLFNITDAVNRGMLYFRDFGLSHEELSGFYRLIVSLQPTMKRNCSLKLDKKGDAGDVQMVADLVADKAGHLFEGEDTGMISNIIYSIYGINFDTASAALIGQLYRNKTDVRRRIEESLNTAMDTDYDSLREAEIFLEAVGKKLEESPVFNRNTTDVETVVREYSLGSGKSFCRIDVSSRKEAYMSFKNAGGVKKRKGTHLFNRDFATYIGLDRDIADSYVLMGSAEKVAEHYTSIGMRISNSTVRRIAKEVLGGEYMKIASKRSVLFRKSNYLMQETA